MPDDSGSSSSNSSPSGSQRLAKGLGNVGDTLQQAQQRSAQGVEQSLQDEKRDEEGFRNTVTQRLGSMKHGGKVKRTGDYLLHKGETVRPAKSKRSKSKR